VRERLAPGEKLLLWVGSSKRTLLTFPPSVVDQIGTALSVAQFGGKHPAAKPWRGEGPGVFEIIENYDRSTYRAVYTVRFENAVYVLHCFQKKSPDGVRTAKHDVDLIRRRLADTRVDYEMRYGDHEA
jgi:phage-related protein